MLFFSSSSLRTVSMCRIIWRIRLCLLVICSTQHILTSYMAVLFMLLWDASFWSTCNSFSIFFFPIFDEWITLENQINCFTMFCIIPILSTVSIFSILFSSSFLFASTYLLLLFPIHLLQFPTCFHCILRGELGLSLYYNDKKVCC